MSIRRASPNDLETSLYGFTPPGRSGRVERKEDDPIRRDQIKRLDAPVQKRSKETTEQRLAHIVVGGRYIGVVDGVKGIYAVIRQDRHRLSYYLADSRGKELPNPVGIMHELFNNPPLKD